VCQCVAQPLRPRYYSVSSCPQIHGASVAHLTVGLEDVIIVDTPDALLVCSRDRAEEIKPVLDEIARTAGDRYL